MNIQSLSATTALTPLSRLGRGPVFWSYLRYSTKPQRWSDSERRQVSRQRQRAAESDIPFVDKYRDLGVSAFKSKNRSIGMLGQFLNDVREGPPPGSTDLWPQPGDILGVESFDRLCRDGVYDASTLVHEIIDAGIVLMVRDKVYTRQALNETPGLYQSIVNEMERAHSESVWKSERIREVKAEKREAARRGEGIFAGRTGPVWLTPNADRTGYDIIEPRKATVQLIFALADAGHGALTICKILNAQLDKHPTFDRRKNPDKPTEWSPKAVGRVLRDRSVIGEWQPYLLIDGKRVKDDRGPVPDHYPAIIDYGLFRRVQDGLIGRRRAGGRRGADRRNIVLGIGTCVCAGKLRIAKGRSAFYLRCTRSRQSTCTCKNGFRYDVFEPALLDHLTIAFRRMIANQTPAARPDYEGQIAALETGIASKQASINAAFTQWGKHGSDAARQAATRFIESLGKAIDDDTRAIEELRDKIRLSPHDRAYDEGVAERVAETLRRIQSADPEECRLARTKMWHELKSRVDYLILRPDRIIEMRLSDGRDGPDGYAFAINHEGGICGAQYVKRSDGSPLDRFPSPLA